LALFLAICSLAHAGPIVDRIKSAGAIRCGGVPRPGLVSQSPEGAPSGLYLDLCRAIGAALLGPQGKIEFHLYDSDAAFARAANGADDLFFLDGSEIAIIASQAQPRSGPRSISSPLRPWSMGLLQSRN
jgi:general L-amino acid transport system substrate-binding protein